MHTHYNSMLSFLLSYNRNNICMKLNFRDAIFINLIPWPGPQVTRVALTKKEPPLTAIQSSPT